MKAKVIVNGLFTEEYVNISLQQAIEYMQWWFYDYAAHTGKVFIIEDENGAVIFKSEDPDRHG